MKRKNIKFLFLYRGVFMDKQSTSTFLQKSKKKIWVIVLALLYLIVFGGTFYLYAFDRVPAEGEAAVTIPKAATGREIGNTLKEEGVIRSSSVFRLMLLITGDAKKLQSGEYRIRRGLTVKEVIEELKSGKGEVATVTVPEGYTVRQIGELLEKSGIAGGKDFVEEASLYGPLGYMYGPETPEIRGEGFLFPDTYEMPKEYTAKEICDLMYRRTDEMLTEDIRKAAEEKNLSLYSLITIASMVEREARLKEDQKPIAEVILARLEKDMPLQIDATVQYALGKQKPELTVEDTKTESPYNTYLRKGLPPGPIGSPGIAAIRAVLEAVPGEYLYYVALPDGRHVFTKTYEEHLAEIDKIYGANQ